MRFFGGTRDEWLDTPVADIEGLAGEIESIRAAECMTFSTVISVGTGSLKKRELQRIWNEWSRAMNGGRPRRMGKTELRSAIAASGIKIEERERGNP